MTALVTDRLCDATAVPQVWVAYCVLLLEADFLPLRLGQVFQNLNPPQLIKFEKDSNPILIPSVAMLNYKHTSMKMTVCTRIHHNFILNQAIWSYLLNYHKEKLCSDNSFLHIPNLGQFGGMIKMIFEYYILGWCLDEKTWTILTKRKLGSCTNLTLG